MEKCNNVVTKEPLSIKLPLLGVSLEESVVQFPKATHQVPQKGSTLNEITKSIFPQGHILRRLACSSPVSLKLLMRNQLPSPSASSHVCTYVSLFYQTSVTLKCFVISQVPSMNVHQLRHQLPFCQLVGIGCPLFTVVHLCQQATPIPRRWLTGSSGPHRFLQTNAPNTAPHALMTHLAGTSSTSL